MKKYTGKEKSDSTEKTKMCVTENEDLHYINKELQGSKRKVKGKDKKAKYVTTKSEPKGGRKRR